MSAVTDHHLPFLARHELRTDRPADTARLAELSARRKELARQIEDIRADEDQLRLSLLPVEVRTRIEKVLKAIESDELIEFPDEDESETPCPSWCDEPLHAETRSGFTLDHRASFDVTNALGGYLWLDDGKPTIYVSDGDHTAEQARQLVAGILWAVELAEQDQPGQAS